MSISENRIEIEIANGSGLTKRTMYVWFAKVDFSSDDGKKEVENLVESVKGKHSSERFRTATFEFNRNRDSFSYCFRITCDSTIPPSDVESFVKDLIEQLRNSGKIGVAKSASAEEIIQKIQLEVLPSRFEQNAPFTLVNAAYNSNRSQFNSVFDDKHSNRFMVDYDVESNSYTIRSVGD